MVWPRPSNFYGCFKHETCGSEDYFEIAIYLAKATSHENHSRDIDDDPDLLKKVLAGDESWVYGYDIETKAQSSQ